MELREHIFAVDHAIATAPGDLPRAAVEERFAAQRVQFRHDNTILPLAPVPDRPVQIRAIAGAEVPLAGARVFYTTDGTVPSLTSATADMEIAGVDWDVRTGYRTMWRATIPAQSVGTVVRYRIAGYSLESQGWSREPDVWAHDGQGFWFRFPGERGITTFAYQVEPPGPPLPSWARQAVIYQIFLDRFHPGILVPSWPHAGTDSTRHGGTLLGVTEALPYLADLGVNCVWLSPLLPSQTYHRYDGTDYYAVDPALGSIADLQGLVAGAHSRGMRVLLDFVPSHCSWHHPAFQAAQRDRDAPSASWFTFDHWPDTYRCFLQRVPHLPSFNTDDPGVRRYLIDSALFWVRECGIDGFRIDHVIGASMDFWVALRAALHGVRPDILTAGEATDTPDAVRRYRSRLDGILDFPLARALRHTFAVGDWDVGQLDSFLVSYERFMADGPGQVSFLDNHDMDRFLFVAGGDVRRLALAALCQFTLPPTPTIYYGTEIGMSQQHSSQALGLGGDAEARRDMPWDPESWNQELRSLYRRLIALRRELAALPSGERHTVHLDPLAGTYAYVRRLSGPGDDVMVAFNLASTTARIPLPAGARDVLLAVGGAAVEGQTLSLEGRSGAMLAASPEAVEFRV